MSFNAYLFAALFLILVCASHAQQWPLIYNSTSRTWTTMQTLTKILQETPLVYVGEQHDHKGGHVIELELFKRFNRPNTTLSLEMFERDVQKIITGYIENQLSEKFMLETSRPWPNYQQDYRPLVEYAKSTKCDVLASNVPRRYAAFVAKGVEDVLFKMPDYEKSFMAKEIVDIRDTYWEKFRKIMRDDGVPEPDIPKYYRAQCLKDDTMAMSIVEQLNKRKNLIMFAGSFHVEEHLGVVQKVEMQFKVKKLVIVIIPVKNDEHKHPEKFAHLADVLIFSP